VGQIQAAIDSKQNSRSHCRLSELTRKCSPLPRLVARSFHIRATTNGHRSDNDNGSRTATRRTYRRGQFDHAGLSEDDADTLIDQLDYILSLQPGEPNYELRAGAEAFLDELMAGCGDTEADAEAAT
jgi:hypothetical protein